MQFSQIEKSDLPALEYRHFAVLDVEPSELNLKTGITFNSTFDDLDYVEVAYIKLMTGECCIFQRHKNNPYPGTEVLLDISRLSNAQQEVRKVLDAIGAPDIDTSWLVSKEKQ